MQYKDWQEGRLLLASLGGAFIKRKIAPPFLFEATLIYGAAYTHLTTYIVAFLILMKLISSRPLNTLKRKGKLMKHFNNNNKIFKEEAIK